MHIVTWIHQSQRKNHTAVAPFSNARAVCFSCFFHLFMNIQVPLFLKNRIFHQFCQRIHLFKSSCVLLSIQQIRELIVNHSVAKYFFSSSFLVFGFLFFSLVIFFFFIPSSSFVLVYELIIFLVSCCYSLLQHMYVVVNKYIASRPIEEYRVLLCCHHIHLGIQNSLL